MKSSIHFGYMRGGSLTASLIHEIFLPAFGAGPAAPHDATLFTLGGRRARRGPQADHFTTRRQGGSSRFFLPFTTPMRNSFLASPPVSFILVQSPS